MEIQQKNKKYNEYRKEKPEQLDLFSFNNIFPNIREKYSGTVELYDILPKYIHDDVESLRKDGKYLDIVSRDFVYRKQNMQVIISPARILQDDKTSKDFFPSQREEIIEDVLRKFATDPDRNEFLDNRLSVKFSLYDLYKELKKIKHEYNYSQIRESLKILARTNIEIKGINGETTFSSNMFETFGIIDCNTNLKYVENFDNEEQQKEYNKKIIYFVRFNSLVSDSIKNKTWRIINYDQCMQYKRAVSRWLHKRISHLFMLRSIELPYNIMLSTIIRDSGMTRYARINDNLIQVQKCFTEMIEIGSIDRYDMEKIYDENKKNKLTDVKFLIYISHSFFDDLNLNYLAKNDKKIAITENDNSKNYENFKKELKQQLNIYKLTEKDYDNIVSFTKKEEDIDTIKNNIKEAINYINKQLEAGQSCNPIAIIISAIKNDWKNNDLLEIQQDNIRDDKQSIIDSIPNDIYKQISLEMIQCFGKDKYVSWLSNLVFEKIENNILFVLCDNQFVIDTIKKDYLNGIQVKDENGIKYWYKKGIKQIISDFNLTDIVINFKENNKQD